MKTSESILIISSLLIFVSCLNLTLGAPQAQRNHEYRRLRVKNSQIVPDELLTTTTYKPKVYEIQSYNSPHIGDGNFKYGVETSDGLESHVVGHSSNKKSQSYSPSHEGSYTTFDETGKVVVVNYVADEKGFRPDGASLPTPPPIPYEHLKAREDILRQQEEIRQQHLNHFRNAHAAHGRKY